MESPQIKKTKLTSKNRHQLQYGYLSLLLMFASCESEQKKLPLAGFSSLYHVQFTLVSQCSTEYSLPYSFETDLQISTPNRLISTSVDSLSNTSSLPSSSQLASLTFSSSNTRGISIKRVPDLFNGLEFIGQTCPNESRSPSLCLMGYQNILFQTEVQQTQSSSPFSTCQLDVFSLQVPNLESLWNRDGVALKSYGLTSFKMDPNSINTRCVVTEMTLLFHMRFTWFRVKPQLKYLRLSLFLQELYQAKSEYR